MIRRRYLVSGRVQGVGFRYFVSGVAAPLGLVGWVMNLPDGRVEVVASGSAHLLDQLEHALARGPKMAVVSQVSASEISDDVICQNAFIIK